MTNEEKSALAGEIHRAMSPAPVALHPGQRPAGIAGVEIQRWEDRAQAYANYLLGKPELTDDEKRFICQQTAACLKELNY
jgi:hypothetical protein